MTITTMEEGSSAPIVWADLYTTEMKLPVFPLKPRTKVPATPNGVKDAALDTGKFSWTNDSNIGVAVPSGFVVLDVDPRNGGAEGWARLLDDFPETATAHATAPVVRTGAGGLHVWFRLPENLAVKNGRLLGYEGIDVKVVGGYLVAPPSIHPDTGTRYEWEAMVDVRNAPPFPVGILDLLPQKREYRVKQTVVGNASDDRPGSLFNVQASWEEILTPHGWVCVGTDEQDEVFWLRPGGHSNWSASTNYEGSNLLYVFSTEAEPFEAETTYSKFAAYTLLNHDGDYSAAATELSRYVKQPPLDTVFATPFGQTAPATEEGPYDFTPAFPEDHFVSRYIDYATRQTDAALEYHEAAALFLLSTVAWGIRGRLSPFPGGLHLNLYLLLCGTTSRSRKSTSQRIARDLLDTVVPGSLLPARATTEAFLAAVAERDGGVSAWMPDEFGVTLSQVYQQSYLRGLEELLLTLYAGDEYRYERVSAAPVVVRRPYLGVFAAATPESVALAGPSATVGGLLPRFGIVLPATIPQARPAQAVEDLTELRTSLVDDLRAGLGIRMRIDSVRYDSQSLGILNIEEASLAARGTIAQRLPSMLYKVAALSALSDERTEVLVTDAVSATKVVARWAEGADRLQLHLRRKPQELEFESLLHRAMDILRELGGTSHRSQVARRLEVKKTMLDTIEATLADRGHIHVERGQEGITWRWS